MAEKDDQKGLRMFAGDSIKEYRGDQNGGGWRRWARGFVLGNSSMRPENRGPRLLNLMKDDSQAQKTTRHLTPDMLAYAGGDEYLIAVLDERYPDVPEQTNLKEIKEELDSFDSFDSENTMSMVGRFRDAIVRGTSVDITYSSTTQGIMLMEAARLDVPQEAVVRGLARGFKDLESIAWALTTAYPDRLPAPVRSRKKARSDHRKANYFADQGEESERSWATGAGAPSTWPSSGGSGTGPSGRSEGPTTPSQYSVEPTASESDGMQIYLQETELAAAEALLEEAEKPVTDGCVMFEEQEVAGAVSVLLGYKDHVKAKITAAQARGYPAKISEKENRILNRRPDFDKIARRMKCWNCGIEGHPARKCDKPKRDDGKGSFKGFKGYAKGRAGGKGTYLNFMNFEMVRSIYESRDAATAHTFLITSPGYALPDSGAGIQMIGQRNLERFIARLNAVNISVRYEAGEANFKFGNDSGARSTRVAVIPMKFGRYRGVLRCFVVPGEAPLLISTGVMEALSTVMDYGEKTWGSTVLEEKIPMRRMTSGHYEVDVCGFASRDELAIEGEPVVNTSEIVLWRAETLYERAENRGDPLYEIDPLGVPDTETSSRAQLAFHNDETSTEEESSTESESQGETEPTRPVMLDVAHGSLPNAERTAELLRWTALMALGAAGRERDPETGVATCPQHRETSLEQCCDCGWPWHERDGGWMQRCQEVRADGTGCGCWRHVACSWPGLACPPPPVPGSPRTGGEGERAPDGEALTGSEASASSEGEDSPTAEDDGSREPPAGKGLPTEAPARGVKGIRTGKCAATSAAGSEPGSTLLTLPTGQDTSPPVR